MGCNPEMSLFVFIVGGPVVVVLSDFTNVARCSQLSQRRGRGELGFRSFPNDLSQFHKTKMKKLNGGPAFLFVSKETPIAMPGQAFSQCSSSCCRQHSPRDTPPPQLPYQEKQRTFIIMHGSEPDIQEGGKSTRPDFQKNNKKNEQPNVISLYCSGGRLSGN